MVKAIIAMVIIVLIGYGCYVFSKKYIKFNYHEKQKENKIANVTINEQQEELEEEEKTDIPIEIELVDLDGGGKNYSFFYQGEEFLASYTTDNWHIIDSYKIEKREDIMVICQALIEIHPIHGKDRVSYRTAEDMTFEWLQHNLAYDILPKENPWRENAKDVDLDPEDQYRTLKEIYEDRTGKKLEIRISNKMLEKNSGT